MTFTVYNTTSHDIVVRCFENGTYYVAPGFTEPLTRIETAACFPYHQSGEKEKIFGDLKVVTPEHPLYPTALKMYCKAQLLTQPGYADRLNNRTSSG